MPSAYYEYDRSEMLQEVYRRDRRNGRTHKIRHVSGNDEIAARNLRRDRDDRVFKVAQRQLAGTLKIRLVHRVNRKIAKSASNPSSVWLARAVPEYFSRI